MSNYEHMTIKEAGDLAYDSSPELGAIGNGILIDYETGERFRCVDQQTALFLASSRSIVIELVNRLIQANVALNATHLKDLEDDGIDN